MYVCLEENLNKHFYTNCVMGGKKMIQVIIELIEQCMKTNEISSGIKGKR